MSTFSLTSFIGVPLAVLFVTVVLLAIARPDRDEDNGAYAAYLALASVFSLYLGLLALAALGDAISQYLVVGPDPANGDQLIQGTLRGSIALMTMGGASSIAACATLAALMGIAYGYHARRRAELMAAAADAPTIVNVDRAYRGDVCFAMLSLIAIGALVAGSSGYEFFAEKIGSSDQLRDLAMGSLVTYGALILVAGAVFRLNVWGIRGGDAMTNDGSTRRRPRRGRGVIQAAVSNHGTAWSTSTVQW